MEICCPEGTDVAETLQRDGAILQLSGQLRDLVLQLLDGLRHLHSILPGHPQLLLHPLQLTCLLGSLRLQAGYITFAHGQVYVHTFYR